MKSKILISLTTAVAVVLVVGCTSTPKSMEPEVFATFDKRYGDPFFSTDGRMFMTMSPLGASDTRVYEMSSDGSMNPYPSKAMSTGDGAALKAVIAMRITDEGVAWILDLGARKFVGWDIHANELVREIELPAEALVEHSFLQDYALDQKRNRAIIADMSQGDLKSAPLPAFIVVDLETGATRRVAQGHPSMLPEVEGGLGLNPITIDHKYEWVYFGALNGRTIYRVPAASFDGDGAAVAGSIEKHGTKSFSDGITIDDAGNIYVADIEAHGVGVATAEGYRVAAKVPAGQSWPDGLGFDSDGNLYVTVNQLDKAPAMNAGTEKGNGEYMVLRMKPLAPGTVGR